MHKTENLLSNLRTGILCKNPKPHVSSVHAYFPSLAALPNGELLATYTLGEAFEAANLRTHVARSADDGHTWCDEGLLCPGREGRVMSDCARVAVTSDGELIVNLVRHDRTDHLGEGLTNPANMGFVPIEMLLMRSRDCGHTWHGPTAIEPPLVGPSFEMCSPITLLRDGRWLLPTSPWMDWDGNLPSGNRMVAFVSRDRGQSWPEYLDVMHGPGDQLFFWESKIVELSDGRLLAVAWCYDQQAHADRPNQYAISHDGRSTWSPPQSTQLLGQTLTPCRLPDDRILCLYRRMDQPGLWAVVAHLEGDRWVNDGFQPLWGHSSTMGQTTRADTMVETFHALKFGAPSVIGLPSGEILAAFWCHEQHISVIRWFRFTVA